MRLAEGYVYAIQSVDGGPVKVGWSDEPKKRLQQLQGAHHSELTIVQQFQGIPTHETELHSELADHRLRGEWFSDCESVWAAFAAKALAANELMFCWRTTELIEAQIRAAVKRAAQVTAGDAPADEIVAIFSEFGEATATIFASFNEGVTEMVNEGTIRIPEIAA